MQPSKQLQHIGARKVTQKYEADEVGVERRHMRKKVKGKRVVDV